MNSYSSYLEKINEYGEVTVVKQSLVSVVGLPGVKLQELVIFESGKIGQIFSINDHDIDVLFFSKEVPRIGEKIIRKMNFCQYLLAASLWVL